MTSTWRTPDLQERLSALLPGLTVEVVASSPSTNTELLTRAKRCGPNPQSDADSGLALVRRSRESAAFAAPAPPPPPCLLVAEHQSEGRGRMGRTWHSVADASLTFSVSMPLDPSMDCSGLSLAVGVALADALEPAPSLAHFPRIGLKWPNDLWLMDARRPATGRKLGGVLIETCSVGARRTAVIGVGLNVQSLAMAESFDLSAGLAHLDEFIPGTTPAAALWRVAEPLVQALVDFQRQGFAAFAARFEARDLLRGHGVTTTLADGTRGVAQGVTLQGALCVETSAGIREVSHGEVSIRLNEGRQGLPSC